MLANHLLPAGALGGTALAQSRGSTHPRAVLMNPRVLSTLFFLTLWLATSPALANEPATRLSLGLRTGFGLPMGLARGGDGHEPKPLKDVVSGIIPVQLDLGWFVNSRINVGTSFQYAYAPHAGDCPPPLNEGCTGHDLRLGVTMSYHLPVSSTLSPWLGLGTGYEFLLSSVGSYNGLEIVNAQGGVDFNVGGPVWLGPFVTFTAGQYLGVNDPKPHYWLMGGLRLLMKPAAMTPSPGTSEEAFPEQTPQAELIASGGDSTRGSGSRATRIPAGLLVGTVAGALGAVPGTLMMLEIICIDFCNDNSWAYLGLGLAAAGMVGGSALGIDFLGGELGGHGRFWPTLLGTLLGTLGGIVSGVALADTVGAAGLIPALLGPAVGGVIAYELSHSSVVEEAAAATASRPRLVPLVSVSPRGGLIGGLAGCF
jgi:hypothetical protein